MYQQSRTKKSDLQVFRSIAEFGPYFAALVVGTSVVTGQSGSLFQDHFNVFVKLGRQQLSW